jgi:hypothetical protein
VFTNVRQKRKVGADAPIASKAPARVSKAAQKKKKQQAPAVVSPPPPVEDAESRGEESKGEE